MTYAYRYDFMSNAVDEFDRVILNDTDNHSKYIVFPIMKEMFTQKERNDWFNMYCMGGQPFVNYLQRG